MHENFILRDPAICDYSDRLLVPGVAREPLKMQDGDPDALLKLLYRWRDEAAKAGKTIARIVVALQARRDGFWLARWLRARQIEAYVIHPSSVPVPREHRRVKTDRIDTQLLKRSFLGWLRGERKHCSMAAIPTAAEEDARRPSRAHQRLREDAHGLVFCSALMQNHRNPV
jgi:transposase